jgi:hypothetical protein
MTEKNFSRSQDEDRFWEQHANFVRNAPHERLVDDFPLYTTRQDLSRHIARYELVKMCLGTPGSIVECGTYRGSGLMMLAKVAVMLEPYGFKRRVIGFDTFAGFPTVSEIDGSNSTEGELSASTDDLTRLERAIDLFDSNRPISHVPKIELVKGDAAGTIPEWLDRNPYALISMLYLDFDLYEPTSIALRCFLPRMPKGAILAFDELNDSRRPGETVALLEQQGVNNLQLQTFSFEPHITYAVV